MVDRSVTLAAEAEVAIGGGLRLPPGYYRAVKRRLQGPKSSKPHTDPEYFIELSGRQIVAMGGTPGAAGLISAEIDVTQQVREGHFRFSDRSPAPLDRRASAEYRRRGTFHGAAELRKKCLQTNAERVKTGVAEWFGKTVRKFDAVRLSFPSCLTMKFLALQSGKASLNFIEHLRGVAVPSVVGKLSRFFSPPNAQHMR